MEEKDCNSPYLNASFARRQLHVVPKLYCKLSNLFLLAELAVGGRYLWIPAVDDRRSPRLLGRIVSDERRQWQLLERSQRREHIVASKQ